MAFSDQCLPPESWPDRFNDWKPKFSTGVALATLSAVLYGLNVSLAIGCLKQIHKKWRSSASKRRLWGACLYICIMISLASCNIVSLHISIVNKIISSFEEYQTAKCGFNDGQNFLPYVFEDAVSLIVLPICILGADGVLIWRCIVLYSSVSPRKKATLYVALGFLALGLTGSWIASQLQVVNILGVIVALLPLTCATNGIISILISTRLIHAHRLLSKLGLEPGSVNTAESVHQRSPYLTALAICVESSGIIIITAISAQIPQLYYFPILILPQICVLAPLLIIYRVAEGRRDDPISKLEETVVFRSTQHSQRTTTNTDHGNRHNVDSV